MTPTQYWTGWAIAGGLFVLALSPIYYLLYRIFQAVSK